MKRVVVLLMILFLTGCSNKYENLVDFRIDFLNNSKGMFPEDKYYIAAQMLDDVTGDNIEDEIYLIGYKEDTEGEGVIGSNYYSNLYLFVIDGTDRSSQIISLKYTEGVFPALVVEDFNLDGVKDIFISLFTTGCGRAPRGLFNIISYKDNKTFTVFDDESISEGLEFTLRLRDGYFVEILSNDTDIKTSFKLEKSICEWLEEEKIYEDGEVTKQSSMAVGSFAFLEAIDINNDGTYELVGSQYLEIISPSAGLGLLETTLKYDINQSKWIVIGLEFKPFW